MEAAGRKKEASRGKKQPLSLLVLLHSTPLNKNWLVLVTAGKSRHSGVSLPQRIWRFSPQAPDLWRILVFQLLLGALSCLNPQLPGKSLCPIFSPLGNPGVLAQSSQPPWEPWDLSSLSPSLSLPPSHELLTHSPSPDAMESQCPSLLASHKDLPTGNPSHTCCPFL